MAGDRRIPRLAPRTFRDAFAHPAPATPYRGQVLLWPDTFTEHLAPEVGRAAVRVLAAAGFDVALPGADVCCGLTWTTTGQLDGAKAVLARTLDAPGVGDGRDPIVVLEPSCAASLRLDLPELLPHDPRARAVAGRVTTLAELLDGAGWSPPDGEPLDALVQPHCHHQAVLGTAADTRLMAAAGIAPKRVLSGCCGLAGNFGAEAGHERITRQVAELELLPALRETDAGTAILADGFSCRTQIAFLDGRRARHLAEVLADRLDGPGAGPT
jgi:Fe-S oxidoreductase